MTPHLPAAITLAAALTVVTLGYVLLVVVRPFTACRRCDGTGRQHTRTGRSHRHCPRCKGTGLRLRTARRLWNLLRHVTRDA